MKANGRVLIAIFGVLFTALAITLWQSGRDPKYGGKSLSDWLRLYRQPIGAKVPMVSQEAADAVRHIGTNVLPFLVTWMEEQPDMPPWRENLFAIVYGWKLGTPVRQVLLESIARRQLRVARAFMGFEILGETARGAVPDLVRIATSRNTRTAEPAIAALGYLGKDAIAPLCAMITNTAFPFKSSAITTLGQMGYLGTNMHPAIVLLIQCLHDSDLALSAADILGRLHLESDISVPALIECIHSPYPDRRTCGATSLGKFGQDARASVPRLTKLLNDPSAAVRAEARNALQLIAPEALQQSSVP
jgi:hypothetical protein